MGHFLSLFPYLIPVVHFKFPHVFPKTFVPAIKCIFFVLLVSVELQVLGSACPTSSAVGLDPSFRILLADFLDVMAFLAMCLCERCL